MPEKGNLCHTHTQHTLCVPENAWLRINGKKQAKTRRVAPLWRRESGATAPFRSVVLTDFLPTDCTHTLSQCRLFDDVPCARTALTSLM